ncbi:transglycosylase domain-containing protein [Arenibacterium halophilum]|uniref:peptidoglycan glycosyltransferase n=1 Tax=Arenibacterium halophilum TaxID=2583821 RepID=A0ABY2XBI6_9RHOB|nr:transglycosylase domain-containing protein [Arenibacterium halophilum]TMV13405.1 hypothetical protein FGK64_11700 [Arenibacterium halophilum]
MYFSTPPPPDDGPIQSRDPEAERVQRRGFLGRLLRGILLGAALAGVLGALFVLYPIDRRVFQAALTQPLVIFRKSGDRLEMIACICDTTLRQDEVPQVVRDALIATEDRRFNYHFGVDPLSFGKALLTGGDRGGSTLAMQLAKNTMTGASGSISRKFAELFLATRISLTHSKQDVVRLYLSRVNFGRARGVPVIGLRDAARTYFGKPPARLTLAEAAVLVGMINAPTLLNPVRHPEASARRAALVITRMRNQGLLPEGTDPDIAAALPADYAALPRRDRYIEDQVMREVAAIAGSLPNGLHHALTTIDPLAQDQAQRIARAEAADYTGRRVARVGLITLDARGRILAMVGGLDHAQSNWNLAIQARRQAASTAKISTYLAALERGWSATDILRDDPRALQGKFQPRNVDGRYLGDIAMGDCLRQSRNVCTMWLAEQVGLERVAEMAGRLGLTDGTEPGSAVVLGAAETTMAANAGAFLVLANGGYLRQAHLLRAVLGQNGRVLYQPPEVETDTVVNPRAIAAMRAMLAEVTAPGGTGDAARFDKSAVFGKTGTSQENRDAWFVGFPEHGIVTAVWAGPREGGTMRAVGGGDLPAEIFARYNRNLVERFQGYVRGWPPEGDSLWRDVNRP